MSEDLLPVIRIIVRYAVGALVANGVLSAETGTLLTSPEILTAATALIVGAGTELWYRHAKKSGGKT